MAAEGIPVEVACRVLHVSTSGYYPFRSRPLSARAIRHAWLTELIVEIHQRSRGTYGALRVHAELRLTHSWTAVSVRSTRGRPGPAILLVVRISSTTSALYSGGKNRRGRGIGLPSRGQGPHLGGPPSRVNYRCSIQALDRLPATVEAATRNFGSLVAMVASDWSRTRH